MKYIMMQIPGMVKRDVPIIFPDLLSHVDMAEACKEKIPELKKAEVISAGDFDVVSCECSGNSVTLQLESRGNIDSDIILAYDYRHGIVFD